MNRIAQANEVIGELQDIKIWLKNIQEKIPQKRLFAHNATGEIINQITDLQGLCLDGLFEDNPT